MMVTRQSNQTIRSLVYENDKKLESFPQIAEAVFFHGLLGKADPDVISSSQNFLQELLQTSINDDIRQSLFTL